MKNLNIFPLLAEYENAKSRGELDVPNASFINEYGDVKYLLNLDIEYKYEYVDLGLPSGNLWATCNIGATSPEKLGLYFAAGEITGYTIEQVNNNERVFDEDSFNNYLNSDNWATNEEGYIKGIAIGKDAAHVNIGEGWRIPSEEDYNELIENTNSTYTTNYNNTGVSGIIYTSKNNSNSIFFPICGFADGRYGENEVSNSNEVICSTSTGDPSYIGMFQAYIDDNQYVYSAIDYRRAYCGYNIRAIYNN